MTPQPSVISRMEILFSGFCVISRFSDSVSRCFVVSVCSISSMEPLLFPVQYSMTGEQDDVNFL